MTVFPDADPDLTNSTSMSWGRESAISQSAYASQSLLGQHKIVNLRCRSKMI